MDEVTEPFSSHRRSVSLVSWHEIRSLPKKCFRIGRHLSQIEKDDKHFDHRSLWIEQCQLYSTPPRYLISKPKLTDLLNQWIKLTVSTSVNKWNTNGKYKILKLETKKKKKRFLIILIISDELIRYELSFFYSYFVKFRNIFQRLFDNTLVIIRINVLLRRNPYLEWNL